jgi:hypothetical protein
MMVLALVWSCRSSIGAKTVVRDRFDDSEALRDVAEEQMPVDPTQGIDVPPEHAVSGRRW